MPPTQCQPARVRTRAPRRTAVRQVSRAASRVAPPARRGGQSVRDALNQLSNDAAAAGERQRAPANSKVAATLSSAPLAERRVDRAATAGRRPAASATRAPAAVRPAIKARAARKDRPGDQAGDGMDGAGGGMPGGDQATAAIPARVAGTPLAARVRTGRASPQRSRRDIPT